MLLLPAGGVGEVEYRIAYVAFCLEESTAGRRLRGLLQRVTEIDPAYVQFGSPEWFWEHQQVNSYALQVEPERFGNQDVAVLEYREALHVQEVRGRFFARLREVAAAR